MSGQTSPQRSKTYELSVVLPCLNEALTLGICITRATQAMADLGVMGEVVVADNGSTDGSQEIARSLGARVIDVPRRGYGAALRAGIAGALGRYVIMADSDDSYALEDLEPFLLRLRGGAQLVMGNRFAGGIAPGAMPPLHKYLGNPVLSAIGRTFFDIPVRDFHCGMRGFDRDAVMALGLRTDGMEFASELVVKAALGGLSITEVPTTLRPDGRDRAPHLRSWRDGWRHLRFLLLFSPRWLFLYPGVLLIAVGMLLTARLVFGPLSLGPVTLDSQSLLFAAASVVVGTQSVIFAVLGRSYTASRGLMPAQRHLRWASDSRVVEWGAIIGLVLATLGGIGVLIALLGWVGTGFGSLDLAASLRLSIPAATALVVGSQVVLASFFLGLFQLDTELTGEVDETIDLRDTPTSTGSVVAAPADVDRIAAA